MSLVITSSLKYFLLFKNIKDFISILTTTYFVTDQNTIQERSFEEGIFYLDFNHWLNPNNSMSSSTSAAALCQTKCNSRKNCEFWTFIHHKTTCLMFDENAIKTPIADENEMERNKKDIISGPKVCPPPDFSFCCGLGYGSSVTITFFIVLFSTLLFCCCCAICFAIFGG